MLITVRLLLAGSRFVLTILVPTFALGSGDALPGCGAQLAPGARFGRYLGGGNGAGTIGDTRLGPLSAEERMNLSDLFVDSLFFEFITGASRYILVSVLPEFHIYDRT
ncbi:MAG TPA: hypothetical protein VNY05_35670 [Candidatus Acidoferrales bacterium]|nr:hypothetical protein [Candidatus Acidoferrales bacterium]